jgi:hypothetical protein
MRTLKMLAVTWLAWIWLVGGSATAEEWWWAARRDDQEKPKSSSEWSMPSFNPLAPIDAGVKGVDRGVKKLNAGARRMFDGARETLRWTKAEAKSEPPKPRLPWIRTEKLDKRDKGDSSWFGSWFRREEPRPSESMADFLGPSESMADFLGAERLDP